jgi:uracil-DNA glycosylase
MKIADTFDSSWHPIINLLYQEPLKTLSEKILPNISYQPEAKNIFRIFSMPVTDIKVVILGQDPYPTPGNAIGRAFAVSEFRNMPVSLRNIEKEIFNSVGNNLDFTGDRHWKTLQSWEDQGVFLLNSALTVETGKAGSHLKYWKDFTFRVISHISTTNPCIWILWGKKAQAFRPYIQPPRMMNVDFYDEETINEIPANADYNYILQAPHPAAEAYSGGKAGFFGCNHFLFANTILKKTKSKQITW